MQAFITKFTISFQSFSWEIVFGDAITLPASELEALEIPDFVAPEILSCKLPIPLFTTEIERELSFGLPQHFLYFFPEPQGQGSFLPISFLIQ